MAPKFSLHYVPFPVSILKYDGVVSISRLNLKVPLKYETEGQ